MNAQPVVGELRWIGAQDGAAMRSLFATVFGHELTPELQAWKYSHGVGLGLWRDGQLLAHYGGWSRDLRAFGKALRGCEVCDVMVAPQARGSLSRRGAMQQITASFLAQQIGWNLPHAVGFGFPTHRHLVLAEHLKLYEAVDRLVAVHWNARPRYLPPWQAHSIDPALLQASSADWRALERVWVEMQAAFQGSVLGLRDPAWLLYRYGNKPGHAYELLLLRSPWSLRPRGAVVWRRHADHLELLDLVAAPRAFGDLIEQVRSVAARTGVGHVKAWVTESHARLLTEASVPQRVEALDVIIPANAHSPGIPPEQLRDRWFLMGGDTDFR